MFKGLYVGDFLFLVSCMQFLVDSSPAFELSLDIGFKVVSGD